MKNSKSKEAYYERIKFLADTKAKINNRPNLSEGTLIDYKRAIDGVAYGIIKENHHYYIKKGSVKQDPNISDFTYIGGLENIKSYQYGSLSEAEKQRNLIFNSISEAYKLKPNKTSSKMMLTEDIAEKEIDAADDKMNALDAATDAVTDVQNELPSDVSPDEIPTDVPGSEEVDTEKIEEPSGEEIDTEKIEEPSGEEIDTDEKLPSDSGEENPEDGEESTTPEEEPTDEANREIQKAVGKITNKIRETEMTNPQVKSYINSFIAAFKDKLPNIEIEDRKAMANKLLKVVGQDELDTLDVGEEEPQIAAETKCNECGGFAQYAESRGYNSVKSLKECGDDEVTNLVSGYGNAYNDGMNDGDLENVALVIKVINPEMLNQLKNDYGHEEYAEKLTPYVNQMNEGNVDYEEKLNELFGGVDDENNIEVQPDNEFEEEENDELENHDEPDGDEEASFAPDADTMGVGIVKPESAPTSSVDVNVDAQNKTINVSLSESKEKPSAGLSKEKKSDIVKKAKAGEDIGKKGKGFKEVEKNAEKYGAKDPKAVAAAAMWKNVKRESVKENEPIDEKWEKDVKVKKTGENTKQTVAQLEKEKNTLKSKSEKYQEKGEKVPEDIKKKEQQKNFAIRAKQGWKEGKENNMSESEIKVRNYIRKRLEEKFGNKKPALNESAKSEKLKQLDALIDKQIKLYEEIHKKKVEK